MKPRSDSRHHAHTGGGRSGTVQQLARLQGGTCHHEANFRRILPSAMKKLVADGLFEPDNNGEYKITKLGLAHLKSLEGK